MLFNSKRTVQVTLTALLVSLIGLSSCKKKTELSKLTGFLEFSIKDLNVTFSIDETTQKISNTDSLPFQTDVSALIAEFTTVPNATVKIGNVEQVSGTSTNNFSQPVTYTVVAQDGATTRQYTVQVNVEKVDPKTVSWQQITPNAGHSYHNTSSIVFNNKFWTLGATLGSFNSITFGAWSSTDAAAWTRQLAADNNGDSIPRGEYGTLATFQNKLWLIGGHLPGGPLPGGGTSFDDVTNKVWSSADGISWTASQPADPAGRWSKRERAGVVVYNDKLWVVGGNAYPAFGNTNSVGVARNDVWSSADGTTWTQVTAAAAFPARSNPAVFVHNNKIYIAGGRAGSTYLNDIWTSADGITWTELTTATKFTGRYGHKIVAYDDQLFLVGGENPTDGILADLWISEDDGVNWTKINAGDVRALPAAFEPRVFFSMFVHDNAIWIAGGLSTKDSNNKYTQRSDAWKGKLVK